MKPTINSILLVLMLSAFARPVLAQSAQCNDTNKGVWYQTFLSNRNGGTEQQKTAAEAAQKYLDCGYDPGDQPAQYMKNWLRGYRRVPSAQSTTVTRPASSPQRTFRIEEAGIQFSLPVGWDATRIKHVVIVSAQKGLIQYIFVPSDQYEEVIAGMKKRISELISDLKIDPAEALRHKEMNGIPATEKFAASGKLQGLSITYTVWLLEANKPTVLLVSFSHSALATISRSSDFGTAAFSGSIRRTN